jgi:hypothetical protein
MNDKMPVLLVLAGLAGLTYRWRGNPRLFGAAVETLIVLAGAASFWMIL